MWKLLIKSKLAVIAASVTSFLIISPVLAKWSDEQLLPSLASYNIFKLTRDLVGETDGMLKDTSHLESEVTKASGSLEALDQQDQLLASQIETNQSIQKELNKQLAGNVKARGLMENILGREGHTLQFTQQVVTKANTVSGQMNETVTHLSSVAVNTGEVGSNTKQLNGQMDLLLAQLDQSIKNFHFIAKVTDAISFLKKKTGISLPDLPSGLKGNTPLPSIKKPVEDLLHPLIPGKNNSSNNNGENSGLLNKLLPNLP